MGVRRYNIFISSTFKDMDAERDVIKYDVISLLNNRYRQNGVEFHAVDLRFGINTENMTEEDSENAVLDVCLSMIDSSRPFFIGLIGNRYGWIPSQKQMDTVLAKLKQEKRTIFINGETCSVTELEILYASLCNDKRRNSDRCLFMTRCAESYQGMSDETISIYSDGNDDKLESLKNKVHDILKARGRNDLYIPYTLTWNSETQQFDGLDYFCKLVFDNLCKEIDAEITDLTKPLSWYDVAQSMTEYKTDMNCDGSQNLYGLESIISSIESSSKLLISGRSGSGKSVLMSQIYTSLKSRESIYPLLTLVGITSEVCILNNILFLWIRDLEQKLSIEYTSDSVLEDERAYNRLYDRFYSLVDICSAKGIKIICLLDNFDSIAQEEYDLTKLLWLRGDIDVVVACEKPSSIYNSLVENTENEICLDDLKFDINQLIASQEYSNGIMLPEKVEQLMEKDDMTPMQVKIFMNIVSNLTAYDFNQIRNISQGTEIEKINNYIINLYSSLPKGCELFKAALYFIAERMSATWLNETITYLASSKTGLREYDLSILAGKEWDSLKFIVFMNIFKDFFSLNQVTKLWKIEVPELGDVIFSKSHAEKVCRLVASYPDDDLLKQSYIAYYTLLATDVGVAQKYLCSETALNPQGEKGFWSSDSISMLRYNVNRFRMVSGLLQNLHPIFQVRLIYAIISEVPLMHRVEWFSEFAIRFTGFSEHLEEASDLYALGWILNDAALHMKYTNKYKDKDKYEALINGACPAYKKCYDKNPSFKDVKNMYKVCLISKAEILCEKGDFEGALEIYNSIN